MSSDVNFVLEKTTLALPTLADLLLREEATLFDGANGSNREQQRSCHIRANHDYDAVHCWLDEYRHNKTTHRLYQKESERLLLWSIYQRHKAFSSLDTEDFKVYFDFLNNPQPNHIWCGPKGGRGHSRGSKNWRPFTGPLSASSKATAITVIHSLVTYLVDAQYLAYDPLKLIRKKNKPRVDGSMQQINVRQRILTRDEWAAVLDTLETLPEETPHQKDEKERLRFIVHMLYFLGLRVGELVSHTWRAFRQEEGHWWFYVVGKGNKVGKIPVNDSLMQTVRRFRKRCRFPKEIGVNEDFPLVASWRTGDAISARFVNTLLKRLALEAAKQFEDQPEKQEKLKRFSAHWLRHLSASMQDSSGIAFKYIRSNLRHEKEETTRLYVHAWDRERHMAMQKLSLLIADHDH